MNHEEIGGRVKRLRQSAGLSVEALAARSGITSNAIRQLERGRIECLDIDLVADADRQHQRLPIGQ